MSRLYEGRRAFFVLAILAVVSLGLLGCQADEVTEEEAEMAVEDFQTSVMDALAQSDMQIQDLEAQMENLDPETQEQLNAALEEIQAQRNDIQRLAQDLTDEESMEQAESEINTALEQLQQQIEEAEAEADEGQ